MTKQFILREHGLHHLERMHGGSDKRGRMAVCGGSEGCMVNGKAISEHGRNGVQVHGAVGVHGGQGWCGGDVCSECVSADLAALVVGRAAAHPAASATHRHTGR